MPRSPRKIHLWILLSSTEQATWRKNRHTISPKRPILFISISWSRSINRWRFGHRTRFVVLQLADLVADLVASASRPHLRPTHSRRTADVKYTLKANLVQRFVRNVTVEYKLPGNKFLMDYADSTTIQRFAKSKLRTVRVIKCRAYLQSWLHPGVTQK